MKSRKELLKAIEGAKDQPVNAWHLRHIAFLAEYESYTRCDICGGRENLRKGDNRHELCRLRKRDGKPTPPIDAIPLCDCYADRCVAARWPF